jgi:hypothetical protein
VAHRIRGLNSSFAADVRDGVSAASARPDQAYLDNLDLEAPAFRPSAPATEVPPEPIARAEAEKSPLPPVMPAHLGRTSPEAVALELAISSRDTLLTLNDKRRTFAKSNHPDGVDPLFRDKATIRMKIANLLIDEAIRRTEIRAKLSR